MLQHFNTISFVEWVWIAIQFFVSIGLWFPVVLMLIGFIRKTLLHKLPSGPVIEPDYAIIVTAYKQIDYIPDVVNSIMQVNYNNYIVYVVADNCDTSTLHFNNNNVIILRPPEILANNIKSHFYAIDNFVRKHDILTIIDSDNLVHPEYINELNAYFKKGYKAVQGVRKARNLDTVYACLDEAGDIYYRFVDRKLAYAGGSSATLAGSGMAFLVDTYRKALEHIQISGAGFDKVLQYELVKTGDVIAFAEKAIVYDGKTSQAGQLVKQRARWINAWFKYWKLGWKLIAGSIVTFNWNKLAYSQILLRPPLFLLFMFAFTASVVDFFLQPYIIVFWIIAVLVFALTFLIALIYFRAGKKVFYALLQLPKFVFFQVIALLKAKGANQLSVATTHTVNKNDSTVLK